MSSRVVTMTGRRPPRARVPSQSVAGVRRGRFRRTWGAARWAVLAAVVILFLAPFIWMLASSFKSQTAIFANVSPIGLWTFLVKAPTLVDYKEAIDNYHVLTGLANSAIVAVAQVAATLVLTVPAGYALTRLRFRGQNVIFLIIFATFLIPFESIMLPELEIISKLGLENTLLGVFIPWIASPFGLFIVRQAFLELPRELDESAKVDGAGHFRILVQILVPNMKATLAALALVTFLFSWNAFLWPLIVIQSQSRELVQVTIALNVVPGELPNWGAVFAGAVLASAPVLLLFMFLQKYFVRGIATTGLK